MRPITDAETINRLEQAPANSGRKPITDPVMLGQLEYGIDFAGPANDIRQKISALSPEKREGALSTWADSYVAKERQQGGIGMMADNTLRTVARGAFVGPFLDEITAATNSLAGTPYDETLAYQRARDRAIDKDYPVLSFIGQLAGGVAGGIGAVRAGAGALSAAVGGPVAAMAPAATVAGRVGQTAAVGGAYGAVAGAGNAEGGAGKRLEGAVTGGALGAALGGGIGVAGEGARQIQRASINMGRPGAYGSVAESAGNVDEFANQIAVGATGTNQAIQRRTLDILGEEMQRAGGNVGAAQTATVNRIVKEFGAQPSEARDQIRRLSAVQQDSRLMFGEYPAVAASDAAQRLQRGANVNLDDVARVQQTPMHDILDYLSNNGNAASASTTRNAIMGRQEQLGPAFRETLDEIAPRVPGTTEPAQIQDAAAMIDAARQLASQFYSAAYRRPINNREALYRLPRILSAHMDDAAGRSGEARQAIQRAVGQFYIELPTGQRIAMNTLQQLQDARAAVRGQITEYTRQGRDDLVRAVQPVYRNITKLMERMSPMWATANRQWADMNFERIGAELGEAFSLRAGPRFREQLDEFNGLAPQAQDIVRIHFLQQLRDKMDNLGDTHSISKMFTSDHSRNIIRTLFGQKAAITFTRAVRDQRAAEMSQRMTANSATHRRGMAQRQLDLDTGLMGAVQNASPGGVRTWLIERATQLLTENRNRPMAEILTTPISDTARVSQNLYNMRMQQQRLNQISQPTRGPMDAAAIVGGAAGRMLPNDRR